MVEGLRTKLLAERKKNLLQEIQIRREMGDAMMQQIMEIEELHRCLYLYLVPKSIGVKDEIVQEKCDYGLHNSSYICCELLFFSNIIE